MVRPLDETLAALHPGQRAAVTHPARPLLLACGPGSGKTRILTHRIQWLIEHEQVEPAAILALTFSRAAADELRGRVAQALGPRARTLWAGTFHGFGAWLLRRHATAVGRTSAFTILDRDDTRRLVARLAKDLGLEGDLPTLVEALERARTPEVPGAPGPAAPARSPIAALRVAYEARCRQANAFDFLDLLAEPLALFAREPTVQAALRARFRAVLVDEAQDLCALQHALIEALAAPDGAVTLAGDDDQAIYGWRGADLTRLHAFERTYPGGTVLAVGRNYRSTPQIVTTAARLIAHNRARRPKPLAAVRRTGPDPTVLTWPDDRAEAQGLAAACADWLRDECPADRDPRAGDGLPGADRPRVRRGRAQRAGPGGAAPRRARGRPRLPRRVPRAREPGRLARVGARAARAALRDRPEDPGHAARSRRGRRRGSVAGGGRADPPPAGGAPPAARGLAGRAAPGEPAPRDAGAGLSGRPRTRAGRPPRRPRRAAPRTSPRWSPSHGDGRRTAAAAWASSSTPSC